MPRRHHDETLHRLDPLGTDGLGRGAADLERGRALARQVLQIIGNDIVRGDYWKTATVAEAVLILEDYENEQKEKPEKDGNPC